MFNTKLIKDGQRLKAQVDRFLKKPSLANLETLRRVSSDFVRNRQGFSKVWDIEQITRRQALIHFSRLGTLLGYDPKNPEEQMVVLAHPASERAQAHNEVKREIKKLPGLGSLMVIPNKKCLVLIKKHRRYFEKEGITRLCGFIGTQKLFRAEQILVSGQSHIRYKEFFLHLTTGSWKDENTASQMHFPIATILMVSIPARSRSERR